MTGGQLVVRYTVFCVLATLANLTTQRFIIGIANDGDGRGFVLAVFAGTVFGLTLKYVLDKRWIFFDKSRGRTLHGRKFTLYTMMGAITTLIFWGTETVFWLTWQTELMREIGAIFGLTIGYTIKYYLDRRFVFRVTETGGN